MNTEARLEKLEARLIELGLEEKIDELGYLHENGKLTEERIAEMEAEL